VEKKFCYEGLVDVHVHAGPSVADRIGDAADMLFDAEKAGYKAFLVKDHYFPTMMGAKMVEKHLSKKGTKVFGCLCLNNSVGGINLNAVDQACNLGAKIIFMPTLSARNHIEYFKERHFAGGTSFKSIPENPLYYLNDDGELKKEVVDVLEYLKDKPDVALGSGHGTVKEIDKLIDKATEIGIKKILVTHPLLIIEATIDDIVKWANQGAYIEIGAVTWNEFIEDKYHFPIKLAKQMMDRVGYDRIIIDSDLGQKRNMPQVEGLCRFIKLLMDLYPIKEEDMNKMTKINPSKLLGI